MELKSIGVIGAGIMGSGIAQVCAMSGRDVLLVDVSAAALDRSVSGLHEALGRLLEKGRITAEEKAAALGRVKTTTDYDGLAHCDAIIEAATENEQLKLKILERVAEVARPDALIASNTSSISITKLAAIEKKQPDRVIGMHFFNPVPVLKLVELIPGLQTSEATLERAQALVAGIGKTPIVVKNSPGFAVNRILCPMINEAIFVLQEGLATAQDIDTGMKLGCSHPIGPLALADLIGLDTLLSVLDTFYTAFNDSKYRPATLLREMVDSGRLGRKSGRGFYHYF
jgi:3-hydroxybutyryl-CoA dehydrogenase